MSKFEQARKNYIRFVQAWINADLECHRTYRVWQDACRAREQAVVEKNNAWGELEMAQAEDSGALTASRGADVITDSAQPVGSPNFTVTSR